MKRVLTCSVTDRGAAVARRLPFEHHHGDLVATVTNRWGEVDGLVLVCATGIAVRATAPLLASKVSDPGVVCVDDAARWAIALAGGHRGGANALAREVAALLGAEAVVTTATEAAGLPALDALPGFTADGDVAGVTRAWLDGHPPAVVVDGPLAAWPLPSGLATADGARGAARVVVTDRTDPDGPAAGTVVLRPRSVVVGVGTSSGADPGGLHALVADALAGAGLHPAAVAAVATIDRRRTEPAVVELAARLGAPLRTMAGDVLATVAVPNPSRIVATAVGTGSVCEAAALLAGGPGASLVVEKRRSADATVAVARRAGPEGHLAVVGLGPGDPALRTPAAAAAVRSADTVIGYGPYVDLTADLIDARHAVARFPIGAETERCRAALERAAAGERVALVCSGDPGVYAMASLVCELAPVHGDPPVTIVPGVTAALAAGAALGAPLGHDHASISLSDLLTPWPVIERRVEAVAEADVVVSLYNPRSQRRTSQLERALTLLGARRSPDTPAAVVTNVGRDGERIVRTTLGHLDPADVDMLSLVVVGSTTTRWIGERMVTPRGYPADRAGRAAAPDGAEPAGQAPRR
jgi:cobalt-precorrin 5A hydrolase / precorrin-3B C17-methyltransferase